MHTSPSSSRTKTLAAAWRPLLGGLLWAAAALSLHLDLVLTMVLLAALVLLPLGLGLIRDSMSKSAAIRPRTHRLLGLATTLQLPCAAVLALAYALPRGEVAAAAALPWLGFTLLCAATGASIARDLFRQRTRPPSDLAGALVALLYIPIGGAWTVLWLLGRWPIDYPEVIVRLTSMHFHFAGFVLPLIAGAAASRNRSRAATAIVPTIALGIPLLAAGITFARGLELCAAWLLVTAMIATALLQIVAALRSRDALTFRRSPPAVSPYSLARHSQRLTRSANCWLPTGLISP